MSLLRDKVVFRFEQELNRRFLVDESLYHGEQRATDARWVLTVKNLLAPGRLMTRARYAQLPGIPTRLSRAEPAAAAPVGLEQGQVRRLLAELRRNGVVRLPGDHGERIRRIAERYGALEENWEPSGHYSRTMIDPTHDEDALALLTDPLLVALLAAYYGAQPFVRDAPTVNITYPDIGAEEARTTNSDWASDWHWDTPNLISVHVMLCAIAGDGTRMLYAKGSHKRQHVRMGETDRFYSEKLVRDRYPIFDCAGPLGEIFVFDNNGLHRLEPVLNRFRASFEYYWTPGNSLNHLAGRTEEANPWVSMHEHLLRGERGELPPLSPLQRRALAGLLGEVPAGRS